jgi:hypothetical protein
MYNRYVVLIAVECEQLITADRNRPRKHGSTSASHSAVGVS